MAKGQLRAPALRWNLFTDLNESGTVSPMTDQEIGEVGKLPWDGVAPPQVVTDDGEDFADYANFARVDYVRTIQILRRVVNIFVRLLPSLGARASVALA